MSLTPQITLTATLLDYSGNAIGSAANPAYLRIALCGFGQTLPCVPGSGSIGKVASWPGDIPFTGSQITVKLWGNDVIAPFTRTYYAISVLDSNRNVVQSGIYQFTGTMSIDLSNAVQIVEVAPIPSLAYAHEWIFQVVTPATVYTLPYAPQSATLTLIYRSGIKQANGIDYSQSGAIITFTVPTIQGDILDAIYWS